jgi:hypothetical protein
MSEPDIIGCERVHTVGSSVAHEASHGNDLLRVYRSRVAVKDAHDSTHQVNLPTWVMWCMPRLCNVLEGNILILAIYVKKCSISTQSL